MEPTGNTIAGLVARHAARAPATRAICTLGRAPLTYAELQATVASVAGALRDMGLASSDRVALVLPNGPEMAVAFLAVAGTMACAPLNTAYGAEDFAFAFADLDIKAVIVDATTGLAAIDAARRRSLTVIELLYDPEGPAGLFRLRENVRGSAPRSRRTGADDVALLLHTSGTTARPKIVPLTQQSLCVSAGNIGRTLALRSSDVCLNVMPLFHIHGLVGALLSSIAAGASIVCTGGLRGRHFQTELRESGATWYTAVPTMHQAIVEAATERARAPDGGRVRFVRSSSAALPRRVGDDLAAMFEVPVIEAYGMTEATHQIASNPLRLGGQKPGSVGLPTGVDVAVMTASGALANDGMIGEIVVRGQTVTRGYEANPQANRDAFVDGWLRTGDQGYLDADGYLFLTGRLKDLINRGGEKIAPGEVEEALRRHAAVKQAVAFAVAHPRLGEEVAAAVVLKPGAQATIGELRQSARDHLPYFKVPRLIALVDQVPVGPTGKLDRNAIAASLAPMALAEADRVMPRTPLERRIADEWSKVLRVDSIGIDDDYFALGGDSLSATEMIVRVSELLQVDFSFADFVDRPTIAGLAGIHARAVALGSKARTGDALVAIQTAGSGVPIFCPAHHDNSLWGITRLVRHLGKARPVFGLRVPPVDALGPILTVGEIASRNVAEMLRIQPEGPLHLLGPCSGGIVAFEMARQLERLGHRVGLLVMIDSFNRAWRESDPAGTPAGLRRHHLKARTRYHWNRLRPLAAPERIAYLRTRARLVAVTLKTRARHLAFGMLTAAGLPRPAFLQTTASSNRWAQLRYRPGPYAGHVLMLRSDAPIAGEYRLPRMGWGALMQGEVTMVDLPCDQQTLWNDDRMLERAARSIGEGLAVLESRGDFSAESGGGAR